MLEAYIIGMYLYSCYIILTKPVSKNPEQGPPAHSKRIKASRLTAEPQRDKSNTTNQLSLAQAGRKNPSQISNLKFQIMPMSV